MRRTENWMFFPVAAAVLLPIMAVLMLTPPAAAQVELPITAPSAVLIEANTGRVLFEKNAHEPLAPASVTKVFTLAFALEALRDGRVAADELISTSARAAGMGGTQVFLETGELMSFTDLMYGIAVESGNDAAVSIAEHLSGTEEAFAEYVNVRSRELGARNTNLSNASGLPPADIGMAGREHVTSAYDVALVSRYGYTLPMFEELVSTYGPYRVRVGTRDEREFWNRNRMLLFYEGANGIKTGFTQEAMYCLAASAVRNDLHLIAVVMGAPTIAQRDEDIRAMLNWGFSRYEAQTMVETGDALGKVAVSKGTVGEVQLVAAGDVHVTAEKGEQLETKTELIVDDRLLAPVAPGDVVGRLVVTVGDEEVGRVDVSVQHEVPRGSTWTIVSRLAGRLMGSFFQ